MDQFQALPLLLALLVPIAIAETCRIAFLYDADDLNVSR